MRRRWLSALAVAGLLLAVVGFAYAQAGKLPPASQSIPKVGDKAPDITLPDATGKPVKLSALLAEPSPASEKGSWVLLIFYRGYW